MTRTVTLRAWNKAALEVFAAARGPDFLAVATPGAGNTTFALTAARQALAAASPVPDYQYTHTHTATPCATAASCGRSTSRASTG